MATTSSNQVSQEPDCRSRIPLEEAILIVTFGKGFTDEDYLAKAQQDCSLEKLSGLLAQCKEEAAGDPDQITWLDRLPIHLSDRLSFGCFRLDDGSTVRLPAMVALMRDIVTNEPCGVHRTALKPDGSGEANMPDGTAPKKMLGRAKGAVVKLSADSNVTAGLGICEGIEDALTIIAAGWRPMWAALSAGGNASFPVLPGIECLTIFGDADPTGLAAAQECQARWRAAGRECPIVLPPHDGTDWNAWRAA